MPVKLSAKLILENKYLDACYAGDIKTVECMIKKEGKTLKSNNFLVKCLKKVCEGGSGGNLTNCNDIFKIIHEYRNIYDIDRNDEILYMACKMGRLDIFKFYFDISNLYHDIMLNCLYESCGSSNIQLIKFILERVITNNIDWNKCLNHACLSGNLRSVKFILEHKAVWTVGNWILCNACEGGNIEIVKLIFEMGPPRDLGEHLIYACRSKNKAGGVEVFNFLLEKGANNFNLCAYNACLSGNLEMVKLMITMEYSVNIDECMRVACFCSHIHIVEFLINKFNFQHLDTYARHALNGNSVGINAVEYLVKKGAVDVDYYLFYACLYGHIDLVELLVEKGATNWNRGLCGAYNGNHIELAQLMINYGATNIDDYIIISDKHPDKHSDIIYLLVSKGATKLTNLYNTKDFKLYILYCKFKGISSNNAKSMELLLEYPPYVLFVGSRLSKNYNCVKKIPKELFALLHMF